MKKLLFLLLLVPALCYAGNPYPYLTPDSGARTWHARIAHTDKYTWWKYTAYWPGKEVHTSWFDHGLGSAGLYEVFHHNLKMSPTKATLWTFGLGLGNEVKDMFIPYERWGKLGGEGFSYQDLVRDAAGIAAARVFNRLMEKKTKNLVLGMNYGGVSLTKGF